MESFFQIDKCHIEFPVFREILLLKLSKNKNCICCASTGAEAKLCFINVNCFAYDVFDHCFNNLLEHDQLISVHDICSDLKHLLFL